MKEFMSGYREGKDESRKEVKKCLTMKLNATSAISSRTWRQQVKTKVKIKQLRQHQPLDEEGNVSNM